MSSGAELDVLALTRPFCVRNCTNKRLIGWFLWAKIRGVRWLPWSDPSGHPSGRAVAMYHMSGPQERVAVGPRHLD